MTNVEPSSSHSSICSALEKLVESGRIASCAANTSLNLELGVGSDVCDDVQKLANALDELDNCLELAEGLLQNVEQLDE